MLPRLKEYTGDAARTVRSAPTQSRQASSRDWAGQDTTGSRQKLVESDENEE